MAKIKHTSHIEEILGAHEKGGMTERRKHYHDYDGNVTKVGRLEAYTPKPLLQNPLLQAAQGQTGSHRTQGQRRSFYHLRPHR